MKYIQLTRDQTTIVDDDEHYWLSAISWFAFKRKNGLYYAVHSVSCVGKTLYMHRIIMNAPDEMQIDHIDGDGLNNQKHNLRLCTHAENQRNKEKYCTNTSGFKGVYWQKNRRKWMAQIQINGEAIYLGYFITKEAAREAYLIAAAEYHGEFAKLK